ncbi:MAG: thioredoxin family protein [Gammaproteobacteria bacterium]
MQLLTRRLLIPGVAVALLASTGCSNSTDEPGSQGPDTQPATADATAPPQTKATDSGIAWFDGSVDDAFAAARTEGKPVFLYWGAEWCPPCHLVKATVFKSRSFIDRSRLFVPVYLDGDTANAQALGERFGVLGYPTMILFRPDGEEITRIPGSSDVTAYANALDVSLDSESAVSTLLANLLAQPTALDDSKCGQLAFHSWGQDQKILVDRDALNVHRTIYEQCPASASLARSVAWMNYMAEVARAEEGTATLSEAARSRAVATTVALLKDNAAVSANSYAVLFDGAPITSTLTMPGTPDRRSLIDAFNATYLRMAADASRFRGDRLYAHSGRLSFERIDDPEREPSAALRADILAAVAAADAATDDVYERQSVMNTANNVLMDAGLLDESKALLINEIGISKQPYYFMVSLADVLQQQGNIADALGWLKRAWEVCDGPATRFQWGNYYIAGLLEMVPEQTDLIRDTVLQVFDELAETKAFYQRPRRQLARLKSRLSTWSEDPATAPAMATIRERVGEVCASLPEDDAAKTTCLGFLEA